MSLHGDRVMKFCEASLRSFRDPNMEKVLQIVGRFGGDLRERLETVVQDEQRDHIDSVYGNRDQIVHRGQSGISLARVKEYFGSARVVVQTVQELLLSAG